MSTQAKYTAEEVTAICVSVLAECMSGEGVGRDINTDDLRDKLRAKQQNTGISCRAMHAFRAATKQEKEGASEPFMELFEKACLAEVTRIAEIMPEILNGRFTPVDKTAPRNQLSPAPIPDAAA